MIEQSLAQPTRPSTPEPAYVLRGLGLFELRGDEILGSYQGGRRFVVPSGSAASRMYEVRIGTRPEHNRCECRGWASHGHCSHLVAAKHVFKKSAACDGCGQRRWSREVVEITDDHDSLTWFVGDLLCSGCVRAHGGIS